MYDKTDGGLGKLSADVRAMVQLHQAGWLISDFVARGEDGRDTWIVSGSNGENKVRVEGSDSAEAWGRAAEQAQLLGMLGKDRPGSK